jgi:DNA-directed RNA polymerase subunit K
LKGEKYTRFERARIVGARALQIFMGAPVLIRTESIDPLEIALEEMRLGVIPITVKRDRKR